MLKVTDEAASALASARSASGKPDDYGVRFFLDQKEDEERPRVEFAFVPSPEPDDEVSRETKVPVFVAPALVQAVGDATLDARPTGDGAELILRP